MREAGDERAPISETVSRRPSRERRRAADDAPGFTPLPTKVRPPRPAPAEVRRDALLDRLTRTRESLVIVEAPAGYGKSTLLAQWVASAQRPSAWLQLDASENDALVFLRYLTATVAPLVAIDPALPELLELRAPPVEERILPDLAAAVAAASPFLLVLDDCHLLHNETCWRYIAVLLDQVPDGAHVAIGTRHEPPLALARLRAAGRLAVLRSDDLRMADAEAAQLLEALGCATERETVLDLVETTEGWPIGLSLAGLAGRHGDACDAEPTAKALRRVNGDQHDIAAYLTSEVLDRQPSSAREFMMRTAILDQLSGPLCRAVTRHEDAHALLAGLVRQSLFVVALDDRDEWYRYHHLFGQLLRTELARRGSEDESELHRRAAAWYRTHDDGDRAVRHGIAAGDGPAFVDLAAHTCDEHIVCGQAERARQLFELLPDQLVERSALLQLTAGMISRHVVDARVSRWARAALAAKVDDVPSPTGIMTMRGWQLLLAADLGLDGVSRAREDAALACRMDIGTDPSWTGWAARVYGTALYLTGAARKAETVLRAELPRSAFDRDEEAGVLSILILLLADQDRWDEVLELDAHLTDLRAPQVQQSVLLARVRVLAHKGDPALPVHVARAAHELETKFAGQDHRALHAAVVFGEAMLEHGDAEAAETWTARAETILGRYPDAGILRGSTLRLRAALERRRMTDPPTSAEQRVLELLPSRLTATQMAARLFVTTNTVKTHMRHLYAKLGVTTRAAAVERSRELGLLRRTDES